MHYLHANKKFMYRHNILFALQSEELKQVIKLLWQIELQYQQNNKYHATWAETNNNGHNPIAINSSAQNHSSHRGLGKRGISNHKITAQAYKDFEI